MRLSQAQRIALFEALNDGLNYNDLEIVVDIRLGETLANIVGQNDPFPTAVRRVVQAAEHGDWIDKLAIAAQSYAPKNTKLYAVAHELGATATSRTTLPSLQLERVLREDLGLVDPREWIEKISISEPRVVKIEMPSSGGQLNGTGFLIGKDRVLTNYHNIEAFLEFQKETTSGVVADPQKAFLRFDYKILSDGTTINSGKIYRLATNWLIASSPGDENFEAGLDKLDYAVLKVDGFPADDILGQGSRGHFELSKVADYPFDVDSALVILQHPKGEPLKLAFDTNAIIRASKSRVQYRTNTDEGSSGSPCFSFKEFALVALHHAGKDDIPPRAGFNQGIPMFTIVNDLKAKGIL